MHELALLNMPRLLEAAFADVDRARRRVLVETYIIRDDRMGRLLRDHLVAAARRGVTVRLLYDAHGSIEAHPGIFRDLRDGGVEVRVYRPLAPLVGHLSLGVRNHSRMFIADAAAYTGGYAWADEWLPRALGGGGWHDLACRVVGPVVEDFAALFDRRWVEREGAPSVFDTGGAHPDVRLVSCGPSSDPLVLRCLLEAIEGARERVWMENAYFFPSSPLLARLVDAAARGVDVRVVLPADSDLRIIARAARAEYRDWLQAGLGIWEYLPTVSHGKAMLVDDRWSAIGTLNANPTSGRFSIELALLVQTRRFAEVLAAQLEGDMAQSRQVTEEDLHTRLVEGTLQELAHAAMSITDRVLTPGP
jgi:cardiolipin synthase